MVIFSFSNYLERMIAGVIGYNPPNSPNYSEWICSCLQKTREAMPVIFFHALKKQIPDRTGRGGKFELSCQTACAVHR